MKLKISSQISLPLNAVTQTFSILAKRRAGKTYTALVMAEEFVAASIPFVFIDPMGAAWGLRSSLDGKSEGLPVTIIGGAHGDVPLEHTAGKVIADLVVDHPGYYVIDMSLTQSNAEQDRFACDFAERLYRKKESSRSPLHLFVDEADSFAPQRPMPGQQRMLGAFEALVRRGGIRGIGVTLITQRPAVLNKNVLTQTECLIVLQMTGPQDQGAIDDWVQGNGTKEQRDTLIKSLASLQKGRAWVWSPSWLQCFCIVDVRRRHTFDSSATPEAGQTPVVPKQLAKVDIEKLGAEIKATVERVKESDPALLRKTISELRARVKGLEQEIALEVPEKEILTAEQEDNLSRLADDSAGLHVAAIKLTDKAEQLVSEMQKLRSTIKPPAEASRAIKRDYGFENPHRRAVVTSHTDSYVPKIIKEQWKPIVTGEAMINKCGMSILRALAQYSEGRSQRQVAILTGYSVTSGGFANSLAKLRVQQLITRTQPIQITQKGLHLVGEVDPLPVGKELADMWLGQLKKCERDILRKLIEIYPEGMSHHDLALITHYSPTSGGFANSLSRLRTLELIDRGSPIRASEDFFQ